MDAPIRSLLDALKHGLAELYGDRLRGLYLYGSYARGEADAESDLDILVVLDRVERYGEEIDRTSELIARLSLDREITVSPVFISLTDWSAGQSTFLFNVRDEAVAA